jgi:peptide/nickel transport system permease protein
MVKFILRRLIQSIPTLFGITVLTFFLMILAPGGPESLVVENPRLRPEQIRAIAAMNGANDPWIIQYIRWLIGNDWECRDRNLLDESTECTYGIRRGILRGDFGFSTSIGNRPVIQVISERIIPTVELGVLSLVVSLALGIPIGILAAVWRGGAFDNATRVMAVIFSAVPIFWLGLTLLLIFAFALDWLPSGNRCPPLHPATLRGSCPPIYERLDHLLLPVIVLSVGGIAGFSRFMRASTLEVINQDYIRTARAKGLSDQVVWFGHAARNALIPIATFLGPAITGVIGGAAITETIFSWQGIGLLSLQAIQQQDYSVTMAVVLMLSIATVLGFIISDVLYAVIDPRIRFD